MKCNIFVIMLMMATVCTYAEDDTWYDFSGVREFYNVAETVANGDEPSEEQVEALFQTPGYAQLLREFKSELMIRVMKIALDPKSDDTLDQLLIDKDAVGKGFRNWFYTSFVESARYSWANKSTILAKMQELKTYPLFEKATEKLLRFLPETELEGMPKIAFVIFNDSRGYDPVVMSLNILAKESEELLEADISRLEEAGLKREDVHMLYFAHEFFHYYRDSVQQVHFPEPDSAEAFLVSKLDQVVNEGVADQINITPLYSKCAPLEHWDMGQRVAREQAEEELRISELDRLLPLSAEEKISDEDLVRELRKVILRSGHPMGYYMSSVITSIDGEEALASLSRNPFQFIYFYNDAAAKSEGTPVFSDKSLSYLKTLEAKYVR